MDKLTLSPSRAAVLATILAAAAFPTVAPAQTSAEWAERDQHCMALRALQAEEHLRLREEWGKGTFRSIDARDQDECRTFYEEALQALEADEGDQSGAAIAPSTVLAQTADEWAERDRYCMALRTLQAEEHLRLREEWVKGTFHAIEARREEECRGHYEEAVQALSSNEADDGIMIPTDKDGPLAPLR